MVLVKLLLVCLSPEGPPLHPQWPTEVRVPLLCGSFTGQWVCPSLLRESPWEPSAGAASILLFLYMVSHRSGWAGAPGLSTRLGEDVSSHPEEAVLLGAVPLQLNVGAGSLGKEFPRANSAHPNRRFLPGCLDQLKMEYKQLQKDAVRRRSISKHEPVAVVKWTP